MKILFLIYHGFSEYSGISKKIKAQIKGLEENKHEVYTCIYIIDENRHRKRIVNGITIEDYGNGTLAKLKKRCCYKSIIQYASEQGIQIVYVRSFHNANPFTIHLFHSLKKHGIKSVMEIPTYPYDQEYADAPLRIKTGIWIDRVFRQKLAQQMEAIVTFSNHDYLFGQRTIRISNGIDFNSIPLRKASLHPDNEIHLIGVAEVHYWHGYDRLIAGLGEYYQKPRQIKVYFHLIGGIAPSEMYNSPRAPGFHELIKKYKISKYIIFYGQKYGEELNKLFNNASFAIGSLARHRSGITHIKTLKNREYAARGIPFIYSETDDDFDNMPYILKAPADESPIDIEQLIDFYEKETWDAAKIRASISHLSWKEQMNKVINNIRL